MLLTEFDEKQFAKNTFNEGYEEGVSDGYSTGYNKGTSMAVSIMAEIKKGNNDYEKLTALGFDPELVKEILELK